MVFFTIFKNYLSLSKSYIKYILLTILPFIMGFIGFYPLDLLLRFWVVVGIYKFVIIILLAILLIRTYLKYRVYKSKNLIQERWKIFIFWDNNRNKYRRDETIFFNNTNNRIESKKISEYFRESIPEDFNVYYKLIDPKNNYAIKTKAFSIEDKEVIREERSIKGKKYETITIDLPIDLPTKQERKSIFTFINTKPTLLFGKKDEFGVTVSVPTIAIDLYIIAPNNYEFVVSDFSLIVFSNENATVRDNKEEKRLKKKIFNIKNTSMVNASILFPKTNFLYMINYRTKKLVEEN